MKKWHVLAGVLYLFILGACTGEHHLDPFPGLANTVNQYYRHERNQDWDDAYQLRSPAYRQAVSVDLYKNMMVKDSSGWTMATYSILDATQNGDKVDVTIEFVERPPANFRLSSDAAANAPGADAPSEVTFTEKTTWIWRGGMWYCYDGASRGHFSMNDTKTKEQGEPWPRQQ